MALSAVLSRAGHPPDTLDTTALVHLSREGAAFSISSIELTVTGKVAGISQSDFEKYATEAKDSCPLSKALKAVPLSLQATLTS